MQYYSGFAACIIPEPALLYMNEAGQQLFDWQSVCQGQCAEPNRVSKRFNALEQRDSANHIREMSCDSVQERREAAQRRCDWNGHNTDRQERKAQAVDKGWREKVAAVCTVGLGENLRPNSEISDHSPSGRKDAKRLPLELLPCYTRGAHQST